MDMMAQVMKKVNAVFDEKYLDEIAREVGFVTRKRKIDPKEFLEKNILLRLESSNSSLEELAQEFTENGTSISKQALHKKINKTTVEFVKKILSNLQEHMLGEQRYSLASAPCVKNVQIIDSSEIRLNNQLKDLFPQVRNQGAAVKLQALMDGFNNQIKLLDIRPSKEPDQAYKEHLFCVAPGDLVIADLGYFSTESFSNICAKEGYFLSRYLKSTHVYNPKTKEKINLRAVLSKAREKTMEFDIELGASKFPCRLVANKLPEDAYKKRLNGLKEKYRKDPRLKADSHDLLNQWTIFITNLPPTVEADILLQLYSLRWQIELLFKMMKTFLALRRIEDANQYRASLSLYVSLIAMTLLSLVVSTIVDEDISLYKAGKVFIKNGRRFFSFINDEKKHAVSWLSELLSRFALKESRKKRPSTKRLLELSHA